MEQALATYGQHCNHSNNQLVTFLRCCPTSYKSTQFQCCELIHSDSVPLDGKNRACSVNTLPALVTLLDDTDADVRAKAAGAIMT